MKEISSNAITTTVEDYSIVCNSTIEAIAHHDHILIEICDS